MSANNGDNFCSPDFFVGRLSLLLSSLLDLHDAYVVKNVVVVCRRSGWYTIHEEDGSGSCGARPDCTMNKDCASMTSMHTQFIAKCASSYLCPKL